MLLKIVLQMIMALNFIVNHLKPLHNITSNHTTANIICRLDRIINMCTRLGIFCNDYIFTYNELNTVKHQTMLYQYHLHLNNNVVFTGSIEFYNTLFEDSFFYKPQLINYVSPHVTVNKCSFVNIATNTAILRKIMEQHIVISQMLYLEILFLVHLQN